MRRFLNFTRWWIFWYCTLWMVADVAITAYYDVSLSPLTLLTILGVFITAPKEYWP